MAPTTETEKVNRYKIFDQELQNINRSSITPGKCEEIKKSFTEFYNIFNTKLKQVEPLFNKFKLSTYVGSVFEGLSVGKSYKEFDMNIHIKMDSNIVKPENIQMSSIPGWVTLKASIDPNHAKQCPDRVKSCGQWLNNGNYLVPAKFYRWGESTMTKLQNSTGSKLGDCYEYTMTKSGPAFTLHVTNTESGTTFDVDIVFTLLFNEWPLGKWNGSWVAVAKVPKTAEDQAELCWRYSFPDIEKGLLEKNNHLKNALRLIKQVRDASKMPYIASYHIKTLFMWEVEATGSNYWKQSLGYLFVTMLYKFQDALRDKRIDFYFDKKCNVLSHIKESQLSDGYIKIKRVTDKIEKFCDEKTPNKISEIF